MNELLEPFERMLESIASPAKIRAAEQGWPLADMWNELAASGFLDALVPEGEGGAGLSMAEAGPLLVALGRHALPLPVAETMVARRLLADGGSPSPAGPICLATEGAGQETVVPFGMVSQHILLDCGDRLVLSDLGNALTSATGVKGSLSARTKWSEKIAGIVLPRPEGGLRPIAALLRSAGIAGAAGRLLDRTLEYARERVQFGKPIGQQQALQQQLAVMAEDVVATGIAVELACAAGLPANMAAVATAKSIASAAAARIANTAHAVHGAIGISEEFDLQLYTRRLHEWRLAEGSEGFWNRVLGELRLSSSADSVPWIRAEIFA